MFDDTTTREAHEALDRMAASLMAAMSTRDGRDSVQRDHATVGAALASRPAPAETPSMRLDPAFKADLIEFATHRIQAVWDDVPGGVDAATLAGNVVAAQEFLWMSRRVPAPAPVGEVEREELIRTVITAKVDWEGNDTGSWDRGGQVVDALLSEFTVTRKVVS